MKPRAPMGIASVLIVLMAALLAFAGTPEAVANDGDPIILGTSNYSATPTYVFKDCSTCTSTREAALVVGHTADANDIEPVGIWGTAGNQLFARPVGFQIGILGESQGDGVMGVASRNGVFGLSSNDGASGVYGENDGTGYGVAGRATNVNGGTGVFGDAPNAANGVGVEADSANGTALQVKGKVKFSKSGTVTVSAGSASKTVTLAGVSAASMVLATAQQNTSVYVKAVVPTSGSFKIYLTGKAPSGGLKVAYFVLN